MNATRYMDIITGEDDSFSASLIRAGLTAMAMMYRPIIATRNALYDAHLFKAHDLGRPTISVGNLTAGGTGKTPIVTDIARRLIAMGRRPAVLLRGYQAHQGLSDEAQLLSDALCPAASVHVGADRRAVAAIALANDPAIDCFILDDAFQHRKAARQLDLVLVDATNPYGHGRMLPRGLLREPPAGLRRASGVIITRAAISDTDTLTSLARELEQHHGRAVMALAGFAWEGYRDAHDEPVPLDALKARRVLGVCGVGNPAAFRKMLHAELGKQPVVVMDDHHIYRHGDLTNFFLEASRQQAAAVVTTEKDWVKWRVHTPPGGWPLPVYRPVLGVQWMQGQAALQQRLEQLMSAAPLSPPASQS